jgi:hypothetical protein
MSNTKREPLLSDGNLKDAEETVEVSSVPVDKLYRFREIYEAARAKDAELIQMAVDMAHERVIGVREKMRELVYKKETLLLAMAAEAGFKPTEQ